MDLRLATLTQSLSICCTMFQHWINAERFPVSHLCVNTLPASWQSVYTQRLMYIVNVYCLHTKVNVYCAFDGQIRYKIIRFSTGLGVPLSYGTQGSILAFTKAPELYLPSARSIQFMPINYGSLRPTFMALFHLRLSPHRGLYPSDFPTTTLSWENFVTKKQHNLSRVLMAQLAHKEIHSIHKTFCQFCTSQRTHSWLLGINDKKKCVSSG